MNWEDIWLILWACSGESMDTLEQAFYPEFFDAIIPGTEAFRVMSKIKADLESTDWSKHRISREMCSHPVYGININMTGYPLFHYERFLSYFK